MKQYNIFLSYSRGKDDKLIPQAYRIYNLLTDAGFTVWFDMIEMKDGETDFKKCMRAGINKSTVFLSLLSPDYMRSYNCNYEFAHATFKKKPIISCKIKPGNYSTKDFHHMIPTTPESILSYSLSDLFSILTPFFVIMPRSL